MSFAYEVKKDLYDRKKKSKRCCELSEVYGTMLFSNTFSKDKIKMISENIYLVAHFVQAIESAVGVELGIENKEGSGIYTITIDDKDIAHIFDKIKVNLYHGTSLHIDEAYIHKPCCKAAFLRGVFLQCGTISDPEKGYHFEIVTGHLQLGEELQKIMLDLGIAAKIVKRKNNYVVYIKESETIEDVLNMMGATKSAFVLMEVKVMRDVRNQINRQVNCEMANMSKTATAAAKQRQAIELIKKTAGLESLEEGVLAVANMRMEYPELSLKEIGLLLEPPISRYGVNHRMQKIMEKAKELQG